MSQQPKRRPGEANPRPDADAPMRPVREADLAEGRGTYGISGLSITRGVYALMDWRKRRKNRTP
jgi:hypothetical protein